MSLFQIRILFICYFLINASKSSFALHKNELNEDSYIYKNPHFIPGRNGIVHLFEWKFKNIAYECENFLATYGYGGVQVSPVNENIIIDNRPWYERYQPITYKIITRSGNEEEFKDMVRRCNKAGVRVYVDVVINHMAANNSITTGTGGSKADPFTKTYPDAGYTSKDFHRTCAIENYQNASEVRNCELVGLHDLDHTRANVRCRIIEFINKLIGHGIAGIRVDAAKHMWPEDLKYIYNQLDDLNTDYFPNNSRPFIYQEVIDLGGEPITSKQYTSFGRVTDFLVGANLGAAFQNKKKLCWLKNWGPEWGLLNSDDTIVFIDNHDNQRGHGAGGSDILTYKKSKPYKMAVGFMLAWPLGIARIMSSYEFDDPSQGPPHNDDYSIKDVTYNWDLTCQNGWMCEHRWRQMYRMNEFRNIVAGTNVTNWWDNGDNQIAFSRGDKGFIAFNSGENDLKIRLQTGLPAGYYCDVISGEKKDGSCTGKIVVVGDNGVGYININSKDFDGFVAIHEQSRLWNPSQSYLNEIKVSVV